ncbi:MAG: pyridoxamine 5'-phosphate oxidase family protein [bacterium]|nr:pyridoxamine 5'-phosphate oxidase family protein [bacterium]
MREMRRKDKAVPEDYAYEILNSGEFGVLSTVSEEGKPYGVPLNFCVIDNCVYFHCAIEGEKIDNIRQNPYVSFCVVGETEILPEEFTTKYESVIIFGKIEEVFNGEKQKGLEGLVRKYTPEFFDKGIKYIPTQIKQTRVFKITIERITGKAQR